ncbi:zinc-binding dehydrogenase [Streptomycetaceae bacterium NBC_01309]
MYALVAAPEVAGGHRLADDVPEPVPGPGQAVVEVRYASVNFGEVKYLGFQPPGSVLGYDAAGYVVRAADDGTGPAVGTPVVAFGPGAWASRAAFDTDALAVLPDAFDHATAAALPLVGITALRTIRDAGVSAGQRVLVTGASGGVGRVAVQLAHRAGAYVIAAVGTPERGRGLDALGADEIVTSLDAVDGFVDAVIELVGGAHLVAAWSLLAAGGVLESVGWASDEPATFPPNSIFAHGPAKTLRSFGDASRPGPDLAELVDLAERGELDVPIGWQGSWRRVDDAIDALLGRRVAGKAVMRIETDCG